MTRMPPARSRLGLRSRHVHPSRRHDLRAPRSAEKGACECLKRFTSAAARSASLCARRGAPAARRQRPDLDLRRRPADGDPGQGARADRSFGFWFARTREIVPNHLLALRADGRSMECRRLEMLPIECVVRGYLSGSGLKDYRATGAVCGHELPEGLVESAQLPEPIFTPATKAQEAMTRTSRAIRPPASWTGSSSTRPSASRSPCTASRPSTPPRAGF